MNELWFIPAIMSIFGGINDYKAGKELEGVARQQELQAEENAVLEQKELDENIRRQKIQDDRVKASAISKAAASGARIEGSTSQYIDYIGEEQGRQLDWMADAGTSRIRLNKQSALLDAQTTRIQAKSQKRSSIFNAGIQAFGFLGQGGYFKGSGKPG